MVFLWPGWLLGLLVVGAVAAWALLRPNRQVAVVGSLALWQEAQASLGRSARRRSRRVTASWALLLAGALAGVTALARPVWSARGVARRISLAVCPSAELAHSTDELAAAVNALLDRLGADDRVELLLPDALGGRLGEVDAREARATVGRLRALPVPAADLTWPAPAETSGHTYRFVPAGEPAGPGGPNVNIIEVPSRLPLVTWDAVGASDLGGGRAQLFLALRNGGGAAWQGRLALKALLEEGGDLVWRGLDDVPVDVAGGARGQIVRDVPAAAAYRAELSVRPAWPAAVAFLARAPAEKRKVALLGPDEPLLRQFARADETLEAVASAGEADLVIASRVPPPAGLPALAIDPDADPPGWRRAGELAAVVLDRASLAADDPVMRHVDLRAVAVRRLRPWVRTGPGGGKVLAALDGEAIILRSDEAAPEGPAARRIDVAFELSWANTNLAKSEAFVIFLANAVRWLVPGREARATYGFLTPSQAGSGARWARMDDAAPPAGAGELPWPGLYRDEAGRLHAVSLPGLSARQPARAASEAVAGLPLPQPRPISQSRELWTILAAAAVALWLSGWALRLK